MRNTQTGQGPSLLDTRIGQHWYATHVAVRLEEFFFATAPWQRRLWDAGTLSALKELLDASHWRHRQVLSQGSLDWFARELQQTVGVDAGVGDRMMKKAVVDLLETGIPYDTRHWRELEQIVRQLEKGYFGRWAESIASAAPLGAERIARACASHLLDRGYSQRHLHIWIKSHLSRRSTLKDLLEDADALAEQQPQRFEILIPFEAIKPAGTASQANWRSASEVKAWLQQNGGSARPVRHVGAFHYETENMDAYSAARVATAIRDRLLARAAYAAGYGRIRATDVAWIYPLGQARPSPVPVYDLGIEHRGAFVRSLAVEGEIHSVGVESSQLDDALELAAGLNTTAASGPALASSWSALESLLFAPGDPADSKEGRGVVAADRAADLVTCSWPRAELTKLAHVHCSEGDFPSLVGHFAAELDAAQGRAPNRSETRAAAELLNQSTANRDKCRVVLELYQCQQRLNLQSNHDIAAQERILALINAPQATLGEVRRHVQHVFRRMYRQRNILVHGGAANESGLDVALRTCAPLVGAALDRVAHAQLVNRVPPLALAARASLSLRVRAQSSLGLADLLE